MQGHWVDSLFFGLDLEVNGMKWRNGTSHVVFNLQGVRADSFSGLGLAVKGIIEQWRNDYPKRVEINKQPRSK
jgi:hypothetical protein